MNRTKNCLLSIHACTMKALFPFITLVLLIEKLRLNKMQLVVDNNL